MLKQSRKVASLHDITEEERNPSVVMIDLKKIQFNSQESSPIKLKLIRLDQQLNSEPTSMFVQKSKFKLKDILKSGLGEEITSVKSLHKLTAEQKTQMTRIKENEKEFNKLSQTLNGRKLTFAKYGFKVAEIDDDTAMKPILKGIYEKEKGGTMLVNELWTKEQLRSYLKLSDLNSSKRLLKRFAHWEWDQNTRAERLREISDTLKVDLFTRKHELFTKKKLEMKDGEKKLKQEIKRKWLPEEFIDIRTGLTKFERQFVIMKSLQGSPNMRNKIISISSYKKKSKLKFEPVIIKNQLTEQAMKLDAWIQDLNGMHDENTQDHLQINFRKYVIRFIKGALKKIQTQIKRREKQQYIQNIKLILGS